MDNSKFNTQSLLTVRKNTLKVIFVIILLNIPGFVIDITTIYHTEHAYRLGDFAVLSYNFTIFDLILCFWGVFCFRRKLNSVNFYPILGIIFLKDLIIYFMDQVSPFSLNSWEMYLSTLIGMSCCAIVVYYMKSEDGIHKFMNCLIVFNFLYQIIFVLTGRMDATGRVSAMSQGYGSVGYMCALHILYSLIVRKKNKKIIMMVGICLISIILSGSRFSLLIVLSGIIIFSGYIFSSTSKNMRRVFTVGLIIIFLIMLYLLTNPEIQAQYDILERMSGLFSGNISHNISNDESFLERIESIGVGLLILVKNPLGISNSYVDLQGQSISFGFFAFPHSTMLTFYLLWGPVLFFCMFWIIKRAKKAHVLKEKGIEYFLTFLIVIFTIYGGIETAPKVYVYIFCLLSAINIRINNIKHGLYEERIDCQ